MITNVFYQWTNDKDNVTNAKYRCQIENSNCQRYQNANL